MEPDDPADTLRTSDADGLWMSYPELAKVRGISKASASRLVRRHKWQRRTDNHGAVRIYVPHDAAERPDRPEDVQADSPTDISRALNMLQEQLERERSRADLAEAAVARGIAIIDGFRTERDQERARADKAEAATRAAQEADAARRSAGRLARLKAAWRGE